MSRRNCRLRRRRDLGVILFGVLGRLYLAAQQLGKLDRLALAASARHALTVIATLPFLIVIRYCMVLPQKVRTTT